MIKRVTALENASGNDSSVLVTLPNSVLTGYTDLRQYCFTTVDVTYNYVGSGHIISASNLKGKTLRLTNIGSSCRVNVEYINPKICVGSYSNTYYFYSLGSCLIVSPRSTGSVIIPSTVTDYYGKNYTEFALRFSNPDRDESLYISSLTIG